MLFGRACFSPLVASDALSVPSRSLTRTVRRTGSSQRAQCYLQRRTEAQQSTRHRQLISRCSAKANVRDSRVITMPKGTDSISRPEPVAATTHPHCFFCCGTAGARVPERMRQRRAGIHCSGTERAGFSDYVVFDTLPVCEAGHRDGEMAPKGPTQRSHCHCSAMRFHFCETAKIM